MLLIVGLGNPGRAYAAHRHNVGFMVVDLLAADHAEVGFRDRFSGEIARARFGRGGGGEEAILLKPQTFMNLSGDCVQPCAAFHKVPPQEVIVIHDDLDLPWGTVRLKRGGGHGGHNGLRDIIKRMGPEFGRVRFGVGRPPPDFRGDPADFVLSPFSSEERAELPKLLETARRSVLDIAALGFDAAMKRSNTRPKKQKEPNPSAEGATASGAERTTPRTEPSR